MIRPRDFALWGGSFMIIFALLSFIFPGSPAGMFMTNLDVSYGMFLGIFPANLLNKLLYLALGIIGVMIYDNHQPARRYCLSVAIVLGVLTVLGLVPTTSAMWGYWPLYGSILGLNLFLTILALLAANYQTIKV